MPNQSHVTDTHLDGVFRALADPTRRAVVQRLARGPASVKDLADPFDMALPSFLQHIKVLEEGGIVVSRKEGRVRTCEIKSDALAGAQDWIADQRALWEGRLDRLEAYLADLQSKENDDD